MAHSRISGANSGDSSLERHGVPAGEWGSGMWLEDGPGRELQEAPGRQAVGRGGYDPEERGSTAERGLGLGLEQAHPCPKGAEAV